MPRPRTNQIYRYDKNDPGQLRFSRSDIEAEMDTNVDSAGRAYVGNSEFCGRRVKILVLRV